MFLAPSPPFFHRARNSLVSPGRLLATRPCSCQVPVAYPRLAQSQKSLPSADSCPVRKHPLLTVVRPPIKVLCTLFVSLNGILLWKVKLQLSPLVRDETVTQTLNVFF